METRRIGSLEVSTVGLGCNNFGGRLDAAATARVVHAALDAGITLLDTADIYGGTLSEAYMGPALKGRRDQAVLATKFGMKVDEQRQGAHPDYVRAALDDSLRRLQTDRIDLYQLHQPDAAVPIADTLGALNDAVQAGKVREIGCSNFSAAQIRAAEAAAKGGARFVSVQNEYSLLKRDPEAEVLPECECLQMAFLPYFPLASGLLTGKYKRGEAPDKNTRRGRKGERAKGMLTDARGGNVEKREAFAEARDRTLRERAFGCLLAGGAVGSGLAGATRPEQVLANVAAGAYRLAPADQLALAPLL
jgi:aryl-alcohol dehydrogenase-like predicted oxidoreductase